VTITVITTNTIGTIAVIATTIAIDRLTHCKGAGAALAPHLRPLY
jgi:hypothetical protein